MLIAVNPNITVLPMLAMFSMIVVAIILESGVCNIFTVVVGGCI